jgi:uncharacterized membrane protein
MNNNHKFFLVTPILIIIFAGIRVIANILIINQFESSLIVTMVVIAILTCATMVASSIAILSHHRKTHQNPQTARKHLIIFSVAILIAALLYLFVEIYVGWWSGFLGEASFVGALLMALFFVAAGFTFLLLTLKNTPRLVPTITDDDTNYSDSNLNH